MLQTSIHERRGPEESKLMNESRAKRAGESSPFVSGRTKVDVTLI